MKKKLILIVICAIIISILYLNNPEKEEERDFMSGITTTPRWSYDCGGDDIITTSGISPLIADINEDSSFEIVWMQRKPDYEPSVLYVWDINGNLIDSYSTTDTVSGHNPLELYDVNEDGRLEIISCRLAMQVFRLDDDGNLIRIARDTNIECGESHMVVLDTDNNGHPYIYVSESATDGTSRVRKVHVDSDTNALVVDVEKGSWWPCHGGFAATILTNPETDEKEFRLYLSDRNYGSSSGYGGSGLRCYDKDLEMIWHRDDFNPPSHCPVIVDINGTTAVVASDQGSSSGIYCINAWTGENIPGWYESSITGLGVHETFPINNLGKSDGYLRLTTNEGGTTKVFNMKNGSSDWYIEASLATAGKAPQYAKVWDDEYNIILADATSTLRVYDKDFTLLQSIAEPDGGSWGGAIVQDIDGDGYNELITVSTLGVVRCYTTTGIADDPLPRTCTMHYNEHRTRTAEYIAAPDLDTEEEEAVVPVFKITISEGSKVTRLTGGANRRMSLF